MMINFNTQIIAEYITSKRPLGGLIFLLPQMSSEKIDGDSNDADNPDKIGQMKNGLIKLEQLLIHSRIPVSNMI